MTCLGPFAAWCTGVVWMQRDLHYLGAFAMLPLVPEQERLCSLCTTADALIARRQLVHEVSHCAD